MEDRRLNGSTQPRLPAPRLPGRSGGETRVNIGDAFERWRRLRARERFTTDAEVAHFLLDSESLRYPTMSSPTEAEQETCSAPVQSSEDGKEACQLHEWTTTNHSENRDIQEDEEKDFSTSLSVGDGRHLVDLGSSSEFVVDEECILQLFKSCRTCNRQCTVRKHVKGLKLVVYQTCRFCQSRRKWTNLPDDDDEREDSDFQINGKDAAHGRTYTAVSPNSNKR